MMSIDIYSDHFVKVVEMFPVKSKRDEIILYVLVPHNYYHNVNTFLTAVQGIIYPYVDSMGLCLNFSVIECYTVNLCVRVYQYNAYKESKDLRLLYTFIMSQTPMSKLSLLCVSNNYGYLIRCIVKGDFIHFCYLWVIRLYIMDKGLLTNPYYVNDCEVCLKIFVVNIRYVVVASDEYFYHFIEVLEIAFCESNMIGYLSFFEFQLSNDMKSYNFAYSDQLVSRNCHINEINVDDFGVIFFNLECPKLKSEPAVSNYFVPICQAKMGQVQMTPQYVILCCWTVENFYVNEHLRQLHTASHYDILGYKAIEYVKIFRY